MPRRSRVRAWTIKQLVDSNDQITVRKNGESNRIEIQDMKFSKADVDKGSLYLIVNSIVNGNGAQWKQRIHLLQPELSSFQSTKKKTIEVEHKGVKYYMTVFDINTSIRIGCSCPDSRFTTEWRNADVKSLVGKKRTYISKGTGIVRDAGIPGLCKHQLALLAKLDKMGIIRL